MNQITKVEESRQLSPSQQFRVDLEKMGDQFAAALPSHIKPEKFQRVVMTAVLSDPDILRADRKSLMESAIRAAQDGLLPDKREGAFVVFNTKVKIDGKDQWIKAVQWMPMVGGIIKRVHQSGDIKMLTARVVYGGDHFRTWIDDTGEHIEYEPAEEQDQSVVRRVFAMATTMDGAVYVEPLSAKDVEKIRNVSKQKDRGPWSDWWEEMAKKSAIRRLAKRLPLSVDIHDLIQRDNGLYDLQQEPEQRTSVMDRLKAARNITPATQEATDEQEGFSRSFVAEQTEESLTGEIIEPQNAGEDIPAQPADDAATIPATAASTEGDGIAAQSSSPSNPLPIDLRQHLMDFARNASKIVEDTSLTDDGKTKTIEKMVLNYQDVIEQADWGKISAITVPLQAVFAGKRTMQQARKFIAGDLLDCSVEEIGG